MSGTTAAASASPLDQLIPAVNHLIDALNPINVITGSGAHPEKMGIMEVGLSTYMVFFIIAVVLTLVIVFWAKSKMALVPKGRAINAFEALVEFVKNNIVGGIIHHNGAKYVPFVATVFIFVLINNILGLIPGSKPGTGTISGTFAIALVVFLYFTIVGIKEKGVGGYIAGLVPAGLPKPIVPLVWVIEFVSMLMRPITQALRLFANMYAGHIVLGIFATLTSLFAQAILHGSVLSSLASPIWLVILIAIYALEILVACIQAYVFALLTAVYIDSATSSH